MKKRMVSLLLAGSLIFAMSACTAPTEDPATSDSTAPTDASTSEAVGDEVVEIQFLHSEVETERQAVITGIIEKFNVEYPNISVEQIPVEANSMATRMTSLGSAGELPEVMQLNSAFARFSAKNQFSDFEAMDRVLENVGKDTLNAAVLEASKTEDGENYLGLPSGAWVQGIWVNKDILEANGASVPSTWDEILEVAELCNNPDDKQYGITFGTGAVEIAQQNFEQFALSNNANCYDSEGNITFDTPEMRETLEYYQQLYQFTSPGSNGVVEIRDPFVAGNAAMAVYPTYMLKSIVETDFAQNVEFVTPMNQQEATYGDVAYYVISNTTEDEAKKAAAETFATFLMSDEVMVDVLLMAPAGMLPIKDGVYENERYQANEIISAYSHLLPSVIDSFDNLQMFGVVDGKSFMNMADITAAALIPKAVNDVTVNGKSIDEVVSGTQSAMEELNQ